MPEMTLQETVNRLKANEERFSEFLNELGEYQTIDEVPVETIRSFLARKEIEVNGLLPAANAINADDGASGSLWVSVQGFINRIKGTLGSASVGHTPIGAGAVATTAEKKLNELPTVLDYMTDAQRADVMAGTLTLDVTAAFLAAQLANDYIVVPGFKFLVNGEVGILDGKTWLFQGAELHHTVDTAYILRVNNKAEWSILGSVTLFGTRTTPATAVETGLYITSGKKYKVQGVTSRNFKGKGIWLDGSNPSGVRGDRGQFTDCSTFDCTVGRQIDELSEYCTWINFNASGCFDGDVSAGGNHVTIGGNIVDNERGVVLLAGANHLHGMHVGVNINHNNVFNIEATSVTLGHEFIGCHLYGNGSGSGAILLNQSKGITFTGGHLDCWVYNYSGGGTSGYNYISGMYCGGSYGDVRLLDVDDNYPSELIVTDCFGPGAYRFGVSINDPNPLYVHARRIQGLTQSFAPNSSTTFIFDNVQTNGDRRRAYDETTGIFTVPVGMAGQYRIILNLVFGGTAIVLTNSYCQISLNNGVELRMVPLYLYSTTILAGALTTDFYLSDGDTLKIEGAVDGGSLTFGQGVYQAALSIERIS